MEVLSGLGVDKGRSQGASCVVDYVFLIMLVDACSFILFFPCAIMPSRRVWAREQNLSRRVFATCLSWMRAVILVSFVLRIFVFPLASMEGRALARAVAMSASVSWRVVPARGRWGCTRGRHGPNIIVGRKEGGGNSRSSS